MTKGRAVNGSKMHTVKKRKSKSWWAAKRGEGGKKGPEGRQLQGVELTKVKTTNNRIRSGQIQNAKGKTK